MQLSTLSVVNSFHIDITDAEQMKNAIDCSDFILKAAQLFPCGLSFEKVGVGKQCPMLFLRGYLVDKVCVDFLSPSRQYCWKHRKQYHGKIDKLITMQSYWQFHLQVPQRLTINTPAKMLLHVVTLAINQVTWKKKSITTSIEIYVLNMINTKGPWGIELWLILYSSNILILRVTRPHTLIT